MPSSYAGSAFIYGTRSTDAIVCSLLRTLYRKKSVQAYTVLLFTSQCFSDSQIGLGRLFQSQSTYFQQWSGHTVHVATVPQREYKSLPVVHQFIFVIS